MGGDSVGGSGMGALMARSQSFQEKRLKDLDDLNNRALSSRSIRLQDAARRSFVGFVTQNPGANSGQASRARRPAHWQPVNVMDPHLARALLGHSVPHHHIPKLGAGFETSS